MKAAASGRRGALQILALGLLLVGVTIALYAPVRHFELTSLDDIAYLTRNTRMWAGLSAENLRWAFSLGPLDHDQLYIPLTWVSLMADAEWGHMDPGVFHMVNVGLQAANVLLLFLWLVRVTGRRGLAWAASLWFAVHPLGVESVAWVVERKDVLSLFFILLALHAYTSYAKARDLQRTGHAYYLLSLLAALAALLSKPIAVVTPALLLAADFWPLKRRLRWGLLAEKAPFIAMSAAAAGATILAQSAIMARPDQISGLGRVAMLFHALSHYLGKAVWPAGLCVRPFVRPVPGLAWGAGVGALCFAALTYAAWRGRRDEPFVAFGWAWFMAALLPVSGILQTGTQWLADRFAYIPMIGLAVGGVWTLERLTRNRRAVFWIAALTPALAWAVLTARQIPVWRNSGTLFAHALRIDNDNYLAHNKLGFYLSEQGDTVNALRHLHEAFQQNPEHRTVRHNLGRELARAMMLSQAEAVHRGTLERFPDDFVTWVDLGNIAMARGDFREAERLYEEAGSHAPPDADLDGNLRAARKRRLERAALDDRFLQGLPNQADASADVGLRWIRHGRPDRAMAYYRERLRLAGADPVALNNLAALLSDPATGAAYAPLEAVELARKAVIAARPGDPEPWDTLAAACEAAGFADEAASARKRAICAFDSAASDR